MFSDEEIANAVNFSSITWVKETIPEYIRPAGGYAHTKYVLDNWDKYIKWLESKRGATTEYVFTLTTDVTDKDKWPDVEQAMRLATHKILTQQTCPVLEAEAYLEYQSSGAPHIHGFYKCDKGHRIYQKIFKRYWPAWNEDTRLGNGHKGGYHAVMKTNKYRSYQAAEGRKIYPEE